MTIWCMRIAYRITKTRIQIHTHTHTHTHTMFDTYRFPTATVVSRAPLTVPIYINCLSCLAFSRHRVSLPTFVFLSQSRLFSSGYKSATCNCLSLSVFIIQLTDLQFIFLKAVFYLNCVDSMRSKRNPIPIINAYVLISPTCTRM